MKRANFLTILLVALTAVGCAALSDRWTETVYDVGDRGERPQRYETTIKDYFARTLKDPFTAVYERFTPPVEGFYAVTRVVQRPNLVNVNGRTETTRQRGWRVTVDVNAKNSYGGYTGFKTYAFVFRGEEIIGVHEQ